MTENEQCCEQGCDACVGYPYGEHHVDPFDDDTQMCGLENPDICESCQ